MTNPTNKEELPLLAAEFMPLYERFIALAGAARDLGWPFRLTTGSTQITLTVKQPTSAAPESPHNPGQAG